MQRKHSFEHSCHDFLKDIAACKPQLCSAKEIERTEECKKSDEGIISASFFLSVSYQQLAYHERTPIDGDKIESRISRIVSVDVFGRIYFKTIA